MQLLRLERNIGRSVRFEQQLFRLQIQRHVLPEYVPFSRFFLGKKLVVFSDKTDKTAQTKQTKQPKQEQEMATREKVRERSTPILLNVTDDLILHILYFLGIQSQNCFSCTCRQFSKFQPLFVNPEEQFLDKEIESAIIKVSMDSSLFKGECLFQSTFRNPHNGKDYISIGFALNGVIGSCPSFSLLTISLLFQFKTKENQIKAFTKFTNTADLSKIKPCKIVPSNIDAFNFYYLASNDPIFILSPLYQEDNINLAPSISFFATPTSEAFVVELFFEKKATSKDWFWGAANQVQRSFDRHIRYQRIN